MVTGRWFSDEDIAHSIIKPHTRILFSTMIMMERGGVSSQVCVLQLVLFIVRCHRRPPDTISRSYVVKLP